MGGRVENGDKRGGLIEPPLSMAGRIRLVSDELSRRLEEKLADDFNLEIQPDGLRSVWDWNRFLKIGVFGNEMSSVGERYVRRSVLIRTSRFLGNAIGGDGRVDLENENGDQVVEQVGKWAARVDKTKWPDKLRAEYKRWVLAMSVWRLREQLMFVGKDLPDDSINRAKLLQRRLIYLAQTQQKACGQRLISQDMMQKTTEIVTKGNYDEMLQGLRQFVNDPKYY